MSWTRTLAGSRQHSAGGLLAARPGEAEQHQPGKLQVGCDKLGWLDQARDRVGGDHLTQGEDTTDAHSRGLAATSPL